VAGKFAFLVGGTHSGCGKTTIALALMAAFKARGKRVQPFKVGPDFIDPGFHTQLTGFESSNLDGWMLGREYSQNLFHQLIQAADMAIVEGVMGLFDGYDGITESGSSAEMAKWLRLPVVLVVDARSMARSAAALVHGFRHFDPALNFAGVIFNQIGGEGHLEYLKEAMAASLPEISVLGGIPREDPIRIPERHLGLVTADEIFIDREWEKNLAGMVERHVDLELILRKAGWWHGGEKGRGGAEKDWIPAFAGMTPEGDAGMKTGASTRMTPEVSAGMTSKDYHGVLGHPHPDPPPSRVRRYEGIPSRGRGYEGIPSRERENESVPSRVIGRESIPANGRGKGAVLARESENEVLIAVARDAAFCFYYPDNFDLLRQAGAELHFFSPIAGESFAEDAAGLYLGGGYPELYGEILSSQKHFLAAIRHAVSRGMPLYAECGGLMVLSRFIDTVEGIRHPMAGVLPFGTRMLPRRKALGYTEVVLQERCLLGERDLAIRGHEFHYSEIVEDEAKPALKYAYRIRGRKFVNDRPEGYMAESALASYVHLHWGSAPGAAASFVRHCRDYRAEKK
jgi:cobyrinic acid a,c-diamide synthase